MAPLSEPHPFGRVFLVREVVGRLQRGNAGPADDVVGVVLNVRHEVVRRTGLVVQLEVHARAHLIADGRRARRILVEVVALGACKEEKLVGDQRPGELGGEVGELVRLRGGTEGGVDPGDRVLDVAAGQGRLRISEVEQAAEAVAAGLGNGVDHGAGERPVFGRSAHPHDFNLLDDVEVEEGPRGAAGRIPGVDAVDQKTVRR